MKKGVVCGFFSDKITEINFDGCSTISKKRLKKLIQITGNAPFCIIYPMAFEKAPDVVINDKHEYLVSLNVKRTTKNSLKFLNNCIWCNVEKYNKKRLDVSMKRRRDSVGETGDRKKVKLDPVFITFKEEDDEEEEEEIIENIEDIEDISEDEEEVEEMFIQETIKKEKLHEDDTKWKYLIRLFEIFKELKTNFKPDGIDCTKPEDFMTSEIREKLSKKFGKTENVIEYDIYRMLRVINIFFQRHVLEVEIEVSISRLTKEELLEFFYPPRFYFFGGLFDTELAKIESDALKIYSEYFEKNKPHYKDLMNLIGIKEIVLFMPILDKFPPTKYKKEEISKHERYFKEEDLGVDGRNYVLNFTRLGWSAHAGENIEKDNFLFEYTGSYCNESELFGPFRKCSETHAAKVDGDICIDGKEKTNLLGSLVNHTCISDKINCEFLVVEWGTSRRLIVKSVKDILCGDELLTDYKYPEKKYRCLCGKFGRHEF